MLCSKHNVHKRPEIGFSNVKPNEVFNYSIVLINGDISNYDHRNGSKLQITNHANENWHKYVDISAEGKFKVAVELAPDQNQFNLHYCCVSTEISLTFIPHENLKHSIRILYIICQNHDGRFQAPSDADNSVEMACAKINLTIRLVQCLYAEMLLKHGFDRKSFAFVECKPFYSSLGINEARQWNQNQIWAYHAKEILAHETDLQNSYKYFGILACTMCDVNGAIKGNVALGIGDVALFGSGTLYAWPLNFDSIEMFFQCDTPVDGKQLINDSNGRNTFGGCYATAVGSICHEIGHIFDLGHSIDGIMGNDIDYVNRMFVIEKCRRELPRRIISKCCTKEQIPSEISGMTDQRLTSIKKSNAILNKYHSRRNDDLTFLTEHCAVLINFHKWFNRFENIESEIVCDFGQKLISSVSPLALVEIRSSETGMCIKYYRFDNNADEKFKFQIPSDKIEQNYVFIVLDKNGNIRKFNGNDH